MRGQIFVFQFARQIARREEGLGEMTSRTTHRSKKKVPPRSKKKSPPRKRLVPEFESPSAHGQRHAEHCAREAGRPI